MRDADFVLARPTVLVRSASPMPTEFYRTTGTNAFLRTETGTVLSFGYSPTPCQLQEGLPEDAVQPHGAVRVPYEDIEADPENFFPLARPADLWVLAAHSPTPGMTYVPGVKRTVRGEHGRFKSVITEGERQPILDQRWTDPSTVERAMREGEGERGTDILRERVRSREQARARAGVPASPLGGVFQALRTGLNAPPERIEVKVDTTPLLDRGSTISDVLPSTPTTANPIRFHRVVDVGSHTPTLERSAARVMLSHVTPTDRLHAIASVLESEWLDGESALRYLCAQQLRAIAEDEIKFP